MTKADRLVRDLLLVVIALLAFATFYELVYDHSVPTRLELQ